MFPRFEIFGQWIYSYPLIMGIAWGLAVNFAKSLNERDGNRFKRINFYLLGLFLFSWVGAKLFYLITADFSGKETISASSSFWLGGGFVFYGGLILGCLYTLAFSIFTKQSLKKFNIFLAPLAFGHGLGRVGCLLAGCCYGKKTDFPLSIELWGAHRHPTQIYEAIFLFVLAFFFAKKRARENKGALGWYLLIYALFRFLIEFLRGDSVRGLYVLGLSTSQLMALAMVVISLFILRGVAIAPVKRTP